MRMAAFDVILDVSGTDCLSWHRARIAFSYLDAVRLRSFMSTRPRRFHQAIRLLSFVTLLTAVGIKCMGSSCSFEYRPVQQPFRCARQCKIKVMSIYFTNYPGRPSSNGRQVRLAISGL